MAKTMKKIKILRIIARLNIGGPARHAILLSEGLDKNNFETIMLAGMPQDDEGDMLYLAKEKGVCPIIIPELGRRLNLRSDLTAFWKIFSRINKEKPDIIHTHTAKAGGLGRLAGLLYKCLHPRSRIILIHTFHGHVLHGYFNKAKSRIFIWIERFLAGFTHRIIAVSESIRNELIKLRIAGPEKIVAISLGLELDSFFKVRKNGAGSSGDKTVAIVGRLVPVKNHRLFLDAAKRIKELLRGKQRIKFMIVGDGPLRSGIKNYAESLGLDKEVVFTGWKKDLSGVYSEADIVVLTSLNEGTPVALIEAQAAACPCVATNVGGVADVITHGKDGFLSAPNDLESFVENILKLVYNPSLIREMGERGRESVRGKFGKERLVRDMENLYRSMMPERRDFS